VELKLAEGKIHVPLEHEDMRERPCLECGAGCRLYKAMGERLGLSWDEVDGIMERAVKRGLERRRVEKQRVEDNAGISKQAEFCPRDLVPL